MTKDENKGLFEPKNAVMFSWNGDRVVITVPPKENPQACGMYVHIDEIVKILQERDALLEIVMCADKYLNPLSGSNYHQFEKEFTEKFNAYENFFSDEPTLSKDL
jgi:hypothetical protein